MTTRRDKLSGATIRRATAEDATSLVSLVDQLGYPSDAEQLRLRLGRLCSDPASCILVAIVNNEVVGVAALHVIPLLEHDQPAGQLIALVVDDRARRQGIGRTLVESIEREAVRRNCFALLLNSGHQRDAAHDFYQAIGYSATGTRFVKLLQHDVN